VFLAASESSPTPAVLIASGITLTILIGASVIAAFPDIRTSSLVIGMCGVMVVVLLAGSLVLGASEPHEEAAAGFVEPAGPAINTLEVDALPTLKFQASSFDVPGGINQIKYIDKGGTHTLVFADNAFPGFKLAVPNGKSESKVEFAANEQYTIYCDIPGHRAAGMEATVNVGAEGGAAEPGTETPSTTLSPEAGTPTPTNPSPNQDPASQSSTGGT
jgi:plastocyanin